LFSCAGSDYLTCEASLWNASNGPLLPQELRSYLGVVYDLIAGADAAASVLVAALIVIQHFEWNWVESSGSCG